jgi:protein-tyrosine phosphatase
MIPSGDDGAQSVSEARDLCDNAAGRGTRVLFATPHVWPHLTLTPDREAAICRAHSELRARVALDLRLGYELTPTRKLLEQDPNRFELEGTGAVLMEVPFVGVTTNLFALAEHVSREGLQPVIAHPERTESVLDDPGLARELRARGWLLQVNSTSLLGRHGPEIEELAWALVEGGEVALVASDGHRATRPPFLDEAFELTRNRLGENSLRLFDGSALGLSAPARTSHAAEPAAEASRARSAARARA